MRGSTLSHNNSNEAIVSRTKVFWGRVATWGLVILTAGMVPGGEIYAKDNPETGAPLVEVEFIEVTNWFSLRSLDASQWDQIGGPFETYREAANFSIAYKNKGGKGTTTEKEVTSKILVPKPTTPKPLPQSIDDSKAPTIETSSKMRSDDGQNSPEDGQDNLTQWVEEFNPTTKQWEKVAGSEKSFPTNNTSLFQKQSEKTEALIKKYNDQLTGQPRYRVKTNFAPKKIESKMIMPIDVVPVYNPPADIDTTMKLSPSKANTSEFARWVVTRSFAARYQEYSSRDNDWSYGVPFLITLDEEGTAYYLIPKDADKGTYERQKTTWKETTSGVELNTLSWGESSVQKVQIPLRLFFNKNNYNITSSEFLIPRWNIRSRLELKSGDDRIVISEPTVSYHGHKWWVDGNNSKYKTIFTTAKP